MKNQITLFFGILMFLSYSVTYSGTFSIRYLCLLNWNTKAFGVFLLNIPTCQAEKIIFTYRRVPNKIPNPISGKNHWLSFRSRPESLEDIASGTVKFDAFFLSNTLSSNSLSYQPSHKHFNARVAVNVLAEYQRIKLSTE